METIQSRTCAACFESGLCLDQTGAQIAVGDPVLGEPLFPSGAFADRPGAIKLNEYEEPPMDAAKKEELAAYVDRRKRELPDA